MKIVEDNQAYLSELIRLNEIWISEHFELEEVDRQLASDPGKIIRGGGHTFSAVLDESVIGVAALFRVDDHEFELARMAVDPAHRGRGVGRSLALLALRKARSEGAKRVSLMSNTKLVPAIALYRSLGFEVLHESQHPEYKRCNIIMKKSFDETAPC